MRLRTIQMGMDSVPHGRALPFRQATGRLLCRRAGDAMVIALLSRPTGGSLPAFKI